jgi:lactoylglutathione lyase
MLMVIMNHSTSKLATFNMRYFTFFALCLAQISLGCSPIVRRDNDSSIYPYAELGPNTPANPATTGYFINHFGLNVNNLTRSIDFYTRILGMRLMFQYHVTEHFTLAYLGYSQGGRNGSGYQTTEELLRNKQNSAGLIELLYFNRTVIGGEDIPGPDKQTGPFSHVGVIVPDPKATQERLEKFGVKIYKKLGEPLPEDGPFGSPDTLGDASNLSPEAFLLLKQRFTVLNQLNIFAADPDGNMIEIQPFHEPAIFG